MQIVVNVKAQSIQFLSNTAIFASYIFIPTFAKSLGANDFGIGLIVGGYSFMLFLSSYVFGRMADIRGRKIVLQVGLFLSAIACITQIFPTDPLLLGVSRAIVGFCAGIYPAALLVYAYETKSPLGKFSSYGSVGWGVGSLVAGYLGVFYQIFLFSSAVFFISFLVSLILPRRKELKLRIPLFPLPVIKKNYPVYGAMLLRHTGAHFIWVIFPLFLSDLGIDPLGIGVIFATNAFTQFLVMQFVDRFNCEKLVIAGLLLSFTTFILFALAQNFLQVFLSQVILGMSWACLYVGSLRYVMERNVERATSTGMLSSVMSLSAIVGPLVGGSISLTCGYRATMIAAALMATIALGTFLYSRKRVT